MRGGMAVAATLLLSGCATGPADVGAGPQSASHTMSDGTVMEGPTHHHDDSHDHGAPREGQGGPSEAARMVCTGDVVDDVTRIMALTEPVRPTASWDAPDYRCTFDLDAGPLVLTVHDAADEAGGMVHFQQQRLSHRDATPIKGVYSLGLPAFETRSTVSFVRDGKTLEVDAGALDAPLGSEGEMTRAELAYAVATSVLACWTDHD